MMGRPERVGPFSMDEEEILRRQREGFKLRHELGDKEYRKIKAAKRQKYYQETLRMREARIGIAAADPAELAKNILEHTMEPPAALQRPKKRGCYVQIMVVDETGEFTGIWEAPALMGTVIPGRRGKGYIEMAKPLLQQIYGKLVERAT